MGSSIAFQMLGVAVGWQMYALTSSAWYLGLVGLAQFLPMLLLTLVAGQTADRYDRRTIARTCQFVEALAAGALGMSLWLARRPLKRRVGRIMFQAVAVFGVATIVFALSRSFFLSMAALVVLGAADVISVVIRSSLVQIETPDEMRGRVSAVNSLFIGTSNQLGEFESGATAALLGTVPSVLIGGIGTLLVVGLWIRLFPQLAQVDTLGKR